MSDKKELVDVSAVVGRKERLLVKEALIKYAIDKYPNNSEIKALLEANDNVLRRNAATLDASIDEIPHEPGRVATRAALPVLMNQAFEGLTPDEMQEVAGTLFKKIDGVEITASDVTTVLFNLKKTHAMGDDMTIVVNDAESTGRVVPRTNNVVDIISQGKAAEDKGKGGPEKRH